MHPVAGIRLGTACAGIKVTDRRDLVVIELGEGGACAAVFTRNAFCAAPVVVAKNHLLSNAPRYLLINTGNANAGTGEAGITAANMCCDKLADLAGCTSTEVLPFSTGVIGEPLPVDSIVAGLPAALENLSADGWDDAAHGIMTTDTIPKGVSRQFELNGQTVTMTGIVKGAGMIRPDMATMLAFVMTDVPVSQNVLQKCLKDAVAQSFNRITVDGDTSTNDAALLISTSQADMPRIERAEGDTYDAFAEVVCEIFELLAQAVIRDAEGVTKFITVDVTAGASEQECLDVAYTVAHSPLVKTAFFASDPNWGRILAAVGRAGIKGLDVNAVAIYLEDVCIVSDGGRAPDYTEARGQAVMDQTDISVRIDLGRGDASARVWTSDLSYDYVRINAEYRT